MPLADRIDPQSGPSEYPPVKWEYIGVGLALVGIGVTTVLALPPLGWPNMPPWAIHAGINTGGALIIIGAVLTAVGVWPTSATYAVPISFAMLAVVFALIAFLTFYWLPPAGRSPTNMVLISPIYDY